MAPSPLFRLPSALRRNRTDADTTTNDIFPNREDRDNKAQKMLGITETDMRIARNQSIASTASSRSRNREPQLTAPVDTWDRRGAEEASPRPKLELRASSVLLHEEYLRGPVDTEPVPPMPMKNFPSSSTLRSHYDSSNVPLRISQQTAESSRRDMALHKSSPRILRFPFLDKDAVKPVKSPKGRSPVDGRKLSKPRPRTSEAPARSPLVRPESGYESVPSIKSLNDAPKTPRSTRFAPPIPSSLSRRHPEPTSKALLEPMDPACLKVNVRKPKAGAKHWFDSVGGETSEEEMVDEPEFEQTFVTGLESAFRNDKIKPPSDNSSVRTDNYGLNMSNSSVATPKQFLQSPSTVARSSPRVAILTAKASRTSLAQQSTRSQKTSTSRRKPIEDADLNKDSFLNLSASDDEEDFRSAVKAVPVRSPQPLKPALRESVALAFNNDSDIELGMAHEMNAKASMVHTQQPRVRTLRVVSRNSRGEQMKMPVPKRGSSLALSNLYEQVERQNGRAELHSDVISSFPATPTESDNSGYRMSVSVFSDTDSISSRRMMSVTKQEESLLAAMRLKKAAMKQTVTRDKRLQALRNLEREQTPASASEKPSNDSMSSFHPRETRELPIRASGVSRDSGTTFQTDTTARQSRATHAAPMAVNRLSLSSADSQEQSASPSLLSLNATDRRQSRDTFYSPPGALQSRRHSRQRTESSHFSNVVSLDDLNKAPATREDITSQDFIDWPYRGWNVTGGAAQGVAY